MASKRATASLLLASTSAPYRRGSGFSGLHTSSDTSRARTPASSTMTLTTCTFDPMRVLRRNGEGQDGDERDACAGAYHPAARRLGRPGQTAHGDARCPSLDDAAPDGT